MKTIADLKRRLSVGTVVTLVKSNYPHPAMCKPRVITEATTRAIRFSPLEEGALGSWLEFPKRSELQEISNTHFIVLLHGTRLHYVIGEAQ